MNPVQGASDIYSGVTGLVTLFKSPDVLTNFNRILKGLGELGLHTALNKAMQVPSAPVKPEPQVKIG